MHTFLCPLFQFKTELNVTTFLMLISEVYFIGKIRINKDSFSISFVTYNHPND